MPDSTRAIALLLCGVLSANEVVGQAPKEVRLGPSRVLQTGFSRVAGVFELPDGRILVSDRGDERVVVASLETGATAIVGRAGSGPEEYRLPGRFARWAGDSILLVDEGNARLAVIGPDLRIRRSFVLRVPGVPTGLSPRAVDPKGRMYAQVPRWAAGAFGPHGDSVPVVRVGAAGEHPEVLAWVRVQAEPPGGIKKGLPYIPFSPTDGWAATGNGELVIARSDDYHVEWLTPGGLTRGPSIPHQALAVTKKDRIAYTRRFLENSSMGGRGGPNSTPSGLGPMPPEWLTPAAVERLAEVNPFAPVRPAFTDDMPMLSADRLFWVQRSVPEGAEPVWEVFDAAGALKYRVTAPQGRRVIALGRKSAYALSTDDDGFDRIERYGVELR
jgi:hypothetical protein